MLQFLSSFMEVGKDLANSQGLEILGNYKFYVEACVQGIICHHSSTLKISAYTDASKSTPLEIDVKWTKIVNKETFEMVDYNESFYHLTPSDIDLKVRAAVTCKDGKHPGVAYVYLGPIKLDISLRPEVEGMILNQSGRFKCQVLSKDKKPLPHNESVISVKKPYFILNFDSALEDHEDCKERAKKGELLPVEVNFDFDMTLKVRTNHYSENEVFIIYKDESGAEHRLLVAFDSRLQRDVFYIFLRLLRSIKSNFLGKLLDEYEILLSAPWSILRIERDEEDPEPEDEPGYESVLKYDLLRDHLKNMNRYHKSYKRENNQLLEGIFVLEDELQTSVQQFRDLLANQGKDEGEMKKLEEDNKSLMAETSFLIEKTKNASQNKKGSSANMSVPQLKKCIEEFLAKNEVLEKEVETLKKNSSAQDIQNSAKKALDGSDISDIKNQTSSQPKMLAAIEKYNYSVEVMMEQLRKVSQDSKIKSRFSELEESLGSVEAAKKGSFSDLKSDNDSSLLAKALRTIIIYFSELNEQLAEVVDLKQDANNNEMKMKILEELINKPDDQILSSSDVQTESPAEVEELEKDIQEMTESNQRLETDLKNLTSRNQVVEKEIKKMADFMEKAGKGAQEETAENLEQKIEELEKELNQIAESEDSEKA